MAFTYALATDVGKVRLLIADSRDSGHIFDDDELTALLEMNAANVRLAAADALETMASNEALVQKAITLLDLKTDGPRVAAELRKHAAILRAQADTSLVPAWAFAENPETVWAAREHLWNEALANA